MISKKLQDAINKQINKELYSEYLYLSMAAYLESIGLEGFANFFKVQIQEERFHAMKFFDYVNERGGRVILEAIDRPQIEFKSPVEIFEIAYNHEQYVTKLINELMEVAIKENDHAAKSFLNWYIDEQVEEEASMDKILNQLKMIGGKGQGMLMLDKELAARTFTPPAQ
ncbi:MAG: ferritin [Candidatus Cloacimonetes bacterium]|nr:ferritin [Candidatus Cloacimonadota bacterium]MBL7149314.1 ferritin [Candidatus Cloacimonadota bacterium]